MQANRMTKILLATLALAALLLIGFRALGGSFGLSLLFVRYVMREDSAPYRDVAWQQGPASAPASSSFSPATAATSWPPAVIPPSMP